MMPRADYEMTEADMEALLDAGKSTPVMMIGGSTGSSPQDNANRAWAALGVKMGFDSMTVRAASGKGQRFFTAVPSETEEAKGERFEREKQEKKAALIKTLEDEIAERTKLLSDLTDDA